MATPQTVAFHTLGCKLNYSETSSIRRRFEEMGYQVVEWRDPANIYILNTCSVTEFADKKCRAAVRKVLLQNEQAKVVVIGCYAQLKPEEIAGIPGVDLVLGAAEKFQIHNYIDSLQGAKQKGMIKASEISEVNSFEEAFSFGDRTRTFLKVQDGCDYKCSFCTIPLARGKSRSNSIRRVVEQVQQIATMGQKEIVLTGVNLGDFQDPERQNHGSFIHLIRELDRIDGIERFRISSIEPNLCSDEIIEFVSGSKRFVPHFHMPLQSGSPQILKLMRRRYHVDLYTNRVEKIKQLMPHACIGVDVIVGFPGETDDEFNRTVSYLSELDISYLHVFTYSERNNTVASALPGIVPMEIRRKRNNLLQEVSRKKRLHFYESNLGVERPVLFETKSDTGVWTGYTDNYIKVSSEIADASLANEIHNVHLGTIAQNLEVHGQLSKSVAFSNTW